MIKTEDQEKVQEALEKITALMQQDAPLNPEHSNEDLRALYTLAYTLYQSGDFGQAVELFEQLTHSKPLTQKYWLGLGACSQMQQKYTEALQAWGMAAILNGSDPTPHFHATECYIALKDSVEGRKALRATKSRLTKAHKTLETKVKKLESSLEKEVHEGVY